MLRCAGVERTLALRARFVWGGIMQCPIILCSNETTGINAVCDKHKNMEFLFSDLSMTQNSILTEADKLVSTDRQEDYGHPFDNYTAIAKGASVIFGHEVTAEQCALFMMWVKMCRELNKNKRDNRVDIAGYAKVLDMIIETRRDLRNTQL